jgi:O-antigen/teichoic acid export membrane protein
MLRAASRMRAMKIARVMLPQVRAVPRTVILSSAGSFLLRVAGLGSAFLLGVVLARALGPAEYGIYGLAINLAALAMNIALLGTPQLAVREIAARSAQADWAGVWSLCRSFLLATTAAALVIGLLSIGASMIFLRHNPNALAYAAIGAGLCASMTVTALIAAQLRGVGAMFKGQFMDIFGRPTAAMLVIGVMLLLGLPLSASGALAVQLAVAVAAAVVSLAWLVSAIPHRPKKAPSERGWLKSAIPLGIVDVIRQFDGTYGLILVGLLGTATELGIYRVATAAVVLAGMPVTILHVVLAPTVSKHYRFGERAELQRLLRMASAVMVAVLVPMIAVLLLFGRPLIALVFGEVYVDSWLPLVLLCFAQLVFGFYGMGPVLLAMADSERHLTRIYLIAVSIGIVVAVLAIPKFGGIGAAAAQLVSSGLIAWMSGRFAKRRLGLGTTFFAPTMPTRASGAAE